MLERMKYNNQRSFGLFFSTMTYGLKKQEMSRRRNKYAQPIANKMLFVNRILLTCTRVTTCTCMWLSGMRTTVALQDYTGTDFVKIIQ